MTTYQAFAVHPGGKVQELPPVSEAELGDMVRRSSKSFDFQKMEPRYLQKARKSRVSLAKHPQTLRDDNFS